MRTTLRPTAWTISFGVHALLVVAFALALGNSRRHARETLTRLVYVEPAAPRAAGAASGAAPGAIDVAPPPTLAPPVAVVEPEQSTPPRLVSRDHRRLDTAPRPHATSHRPPAAATQPAEMATDLSAPGSAQIGGTTLGSATGVEGGTVGGLGDAPLPVRDVAAPPELVERVLPEYPSRARAMQIEGQVMLEVVLDRGGRVEDSVRVTRSIPMLDAAAIAAVRQWRFRPARNRDGRPVRVLMEIPVRFVLR